MSNPTRITMWLHIARIANEAPKSPTLIIAALLFTGLAASMVLKREATDALRAEVVAGGGRTYPSGVFRAPHPAVFAPSAISFGN